MYIDIDCQIYVYVYLDIDIYMTLFEENCNKLKMAAIGRNM